MQTHTNKSADRWV